MGLKTVFMSNSFSAYRFYTAKAILAGYKVAYVSNAIVRHSHNYTAIEEFKRYFDIGVFHCKESWIREKIGGAGGEGKKFIISELIFLLKNAPH